jgi:glycosyltransferase involved in cell wall biosynthesis
MKNYPVTVLMPTYNSEKYLGEAIESILKQSHEDYEFIILDDGSTDNSYQIAKSYQDDRILLIRHKENKGLVATLNEGIKKARGKYIVRMDADDISMSDRIMTQIKYMENNQDIGVCGTWVRVVGKEGSTWKYPLDHESIATQLFFESALAHPSVCIRKSVLINNQITYNSQYEYAEDYKLWIELSRVTKLANIPQALLEYRTHPAQIGSDKSQEQLEINETIKLEQLHRLMGSVSKKDQKIHLKATSWYKNASKQDIADIGEWYHKLFRANLTNKIYRQSILTSIIADHWLALCYLAKPLGIMRCLYATQHPILALKGIIGITKRRLS